MANVDTILDRAKIFKPKSRLIMKHFADNPIPLSRGEICKKFGFAWSTAYDNLEPLFLNGLVKQTERRNDRGRPTVLYSPNSEIFS